MNKTALHKITLTFCFLGIFSISGCTDGVYSPRGYLPEKNPSHDWTPPHPAAASAKQGIEWFR